MFCDNSRYLGVGLEESLEESMVRTLLAQVALKRAPVIDACDRLVKTSLFLTFVVEGTYLVVR